jgi:tRNA A-37 threonylcarbamoyl transferase component Bud32/tetratricopeptide (TPR) repeat protein
MAELRSQVQQALSGSYTLGNELGGGGMSRVFAATETALGRRVVVKVLPPEMAEGLSVERFKREIHLAARLQHAHLVPVLTAGEIGDLPYYTMPFVDGHSLRARLGSGDPLPLTEVIGILRDVAKALAYAHKQGVVHRDIKPENVLLSEGSAVVADFGIAKALAASRKGESGGTLTQIGTSLGTPAYMAPEAAAADPHADHRADLYAFGIMAYEMLAGRTPFNNRTPQKLLAAQMSERPQPIDEIRTDVPLLLAQLVMKCLEKDADDRPQSAADLVRVLESVTSGGGMPAMPEILLGGRRRLGRALATYALSFVGVAILAKAAIIVLGLPDWVFPGALIMMALGLPVILFTAFVHHGAHQAMTSSMLTPGGSRTAHSTMARIAVRASPWVSWRKTATGGMIALGAFAALVGGFMTLRALGIGPAGSLLASGKLKSNEQLIVTDFAAAGADTSLGSAITEAVRADLGESSVISVVPASLVGAALTRMQRPQSSRLDLALAREVAQREGVRAIIDGNVRQLGGGYLLSLRLVAAESGDELASYHETIDGPRELIPAVDKLVRQLRGKIGESLKAVRANPALEEVTTPSLEALKKYAEGVRAADMEADYPKAAGLLRDAVSEDSTFAAAYRKLGIVLSNIDRPREQSDSAFARAFRYRDRLTDRERNLAIGSYYFVGPGRDRQQAAAAYEAVLEHDSTDYVAINNLSIILADRRDWARSEKVLNRTTSTGTATLQVLTNLVLAQLAQKKIDQADSAVATGLKAHPTSELVSALGVSVLYARGLVDSAAHVLSRMRSHDTEEGMRSFAAYRLGDIEMLRGHLASSARSSADGDALDSARGSPRAPLSRALDSAFVSSWFLEQPAQSVKLLDAALARTPLRSINELRRPTLRVAAMYALASRPDRARSILTQYSSDMRDSALRNEQEPELHNTMAEIALAERRPMDAVAEFRKGDQRVDGPADGCEPCFLGRLGRAYDQANMADSTIAIYERYLADPDILGGFPLIGAVYTAGVHKRLGELYEAKGDREKALSHYLAFIALWKDADPELQPKVAEVKARVARMKDSERK